MSLPYVPGHIIDEARDLRRQGFSLDTLASRIGVSAEELAMLLGEPVWKQLPADTEPQRAEFDLWAADRLHAQL